MNKNLKTYVRDKFQPMHMHTLNILGFICIFLLIIIYMIRCCLIYSKKEINTLCWTIYICTHYVNFFLLPDSTFGNMANHYQATFKGVRFGEVPSVQILHQSVTRSLITCSVICLRDFQTCRSFTYESQSNKCSLYSEIYTISSDFIRSPGHTYYVLLSYV